MLDELDQIFITIAAAPQATSPVIACLYTGAIPDFCAPMPRDPSPATGQIVDTRFADVLADATRINRAIHDGAIMAGRASTDAAYQVTGWSFRLLAPEGEGEVIANRGSAFHSSLAMSRVSRVDRVYLAARGALIRFEGGRWRVMG